MRASGRRGGADVSQPILVRARGSRASVADDPPSCAATLLLMCPPSSAWERGPPQQVLRIRGQRGGRVERSKIETWSREGRTKICLAVSADVDRLCRSGGAGLKIEDARRKHVNLILALRLAECGGKVASPHRPVGTSRARAWFFFFFASASGLPALGSPGPWHGVGRMGEGGDGRAPWSGSLARCALSCHDALASQPAGEHGVYATAHGLPMRPGRTNTSSPPPDAFQAPGAAWPQRGGQSGGK